MLITNGEDKARSRREPTISLTMASFRQASNEQVNVFEVGDIYPFKHYLDDDEAFVWAKEYYNNQRYRFEVPYGVFEELRLFLADRGYGLTLVDTVAPLSWGSSVYQSPRKHSETDSDEADG